MKPKIKYLLLISILIFTNGCKKEDTVANSSEVITGKVFGKIYCDTYPAGALIYIDSISTGKYTPYIIDSLTEGIHSVGFNKLYFNDSVIVAQVRANTIPVARCTLKQTLNVSNYLPLTVGSSWIYERRDTGYSKSVDTTSFIVANVGLAFTGKLGVLWLEKYPSTVDTFIVCSSNDTVRFYYLGYQSGPESRAFAFPLFVGKTWKNMVLTITVDTIETVTTKAGVFTNCFRIQQTTSVPNTYGHPTYWIHPNAGIVKVYDYDFVEQRYQIWNLKSYYIAPK